MGDRIILHCECCEKDWDLSRTPELPAHVWKMRCNFCLECDFAGKMTDYYREWWDDDENAEPMPTPVPDNQLCMPFIFNELNIPKLQPQTH